MYCVSAEFKDIGGEKVRVGDPQGFKPIGGECKSEVFTAAARNYVEVFLEEHLHFFPAPIGDKVGVSLLTGRFILRKLPQRTLYKNKRRN